MAFKLPSHLRRSRSGVLHFRIAIPSDLQHYFNTNEIYRSLKTVSVRKATPAAQTLSIAFKRVFSEIRQRPMSDQNKAPKNPLIDPVRLNELMRFTKQRLVYQDEIEALNEEM